MTRASRAIGTVSSTKALQQKPEAAPITITTFHEWRNDAEELDRAAISNSSDPRTFSFPFWSILD